MNAINHNRFKCFPRIKKSWYLLILITCYVRISDYDMAQWSGRYWVLKSMESWYTFLTLFPPDFILLRLKARNGGKVEWWIVQVIHVVLGNDLSKISVFHRLWILHKVNFTEVWVGEEKISLLVASRFYFESSSHKLFLAIRLQYDDFWLK